MKPLHLLALGLALAAAACDSDSVGGSPTTAPPAEASLDAQVRQVVRGWGVVPLLPMAEQNAALADLGRSLFFDKILSGNRDVSCATCHDPLAQSGDGRSLAIGTGAVSNGTSRTLGPGRQFTPRNAPSLFNSGLGLFYIFWDGRVSDQFGPAGFGQKPPDGVVLPGGLTGLVASQAMFPVLNRVEMRGVPGDKDVFGNSNELAQFADSQHTAIWNAAMKRLMGIPGYVQKFTAAYPNVPTSVMGFQYAANAIAAFELQAFSKVNTDFDRFLARDNNAISVDAKRGALLFFGRANCSSCHSGPLIGGQQFANVAVPQFGPGTGSSAPLDNGREDLNGIPRSGPFFQFRVAPLRNVELSAPYFHNGAYPTLESVVRHYSNVDSAVRSFDVSQLDPALRASYHGDAATITKLLANVDGRLRQRPGFTADEQKQLVAFLKSLTDPSARNLSSITPTLVPSGLPVR